MVQLLVTIRDSSYHEKNYLYFNISPSFSFDLPYVYKFEK